MALSLILKSCSQFIPTFFAPEFRRIPWALQKIKTCLALLLPLAVFCWHVEVLHLSVCLSLFFHLCGNGCLSESDRDHFKTIGAQNFCFWEQKSRLLHIHTIAKSLLSSLRAQAVSYATPAALRGLIVMDNMAACYLSDGCSTKALSKCFFAVLGLGLVGKKLNPVPTERGKGFSVACRAKIFSV